MGYYPKKTRMAYAKSKAKRKATNLTKKITAPEATTIAKKVVASAAETKWRGIQTTQTKSPNTNANGSTFITVFALGLLKGDNNQERIGRQVQSLNLQSVINISSTMPFPMHLRVLLLRHKDASITPTVSNVIVDTTSKAAIEFTQYQRDMTNKINLNLWTVLQDKVHTIYPQGDQAGGAGVIAGLSNWSKIISCYKKHHHKIYYSLESEDVDQQPIKNKVSWVYVLAFPNGIIPPPTDPVAGDFVEFTYQNYHYFKDM